MVRAFVSRLEIHDLHARFGHSFDTRDEPTLHRFFDVKAGVGEIAWLLDETAAIAGIAHRVLVSPTEAEIALIVRSDLKRRGIGEFLLRDTLARSASQGIETLGAYVLLNNQAALRLAAKIGYDLRRASIWSVEVTFAVGRGTAA